MSICARWGLPASGQPWLEATIRGLTKLEAGNHRVPPAELSSSTAVSWRIGPQILRNLNVFRYLYHIIYIRVYGHGKSSDGSFSFSFFGWFDLQERILMAVVGIRIPRPDLGLLTEGMVLGLGNLGEIHLVTFTPTLIIRYFLICGNNWNFLLCWYPRVFLGDWNEVDLGLRLTKLFNVA